MSLLLVALSIMAPQAAPGDTEVKKERRICRKIVDTGSLIRGKRECRTASEWDKLAQAARSGSQYIVDQNAGGIITN